MIVPVGLLGLATISPAGGSGRAVHSSSMATVGWKRVWDRSRVRRRGSPARQRVAVCRVAGTAHRHRVAGVEGGEEERGEAGRGAGRHDDLGGVDAQAVGVGIVPAIASRSGRMPVASV
jgi:hypothetical protein